MKKTLGGDFGHRCRFFFLRITLAVPPKLWNLAPGRGLLEGKNSHVFHHKIIIAPNSRSAIIMGGVSSEKRGFS